MSIYKSAQEKCALSPQNVETNFSADLQFIYMLAFDFRLIYNPTRLCLGVYLGKQTMVVGEAKGSLGNMGPLLPSQELAMLVLSLLFWFYL